MPSVCYNTLTSTRVSALTSDTTLTESLVQIDCYAETYPVVRDVQTKVINVLRRYKGEVVSVAIEDVIIEDEREIREEDTKLFRVSIDFLFIYREFEDDAVFYVDLQTSVRPLLGGDVTVSRADAACTYIDSNGMLQNAESNRARISRRGAIVERSGQNEVHYFDQIDNVWWTANNISAFNTGVSIADRASKSIVSSSASDIHNISKSLTTVSDGYNTMCGLFKSGVDSYVYFRTLDLSTFDASTIWFNLSTGAVGTISNGVNSGFLNYRIEAVDNGYYISVVSNGDTGTSTLFVFGASNADAVMTYSGDGVSDSIWMSALSIETDIQPGDYPWVPAMPVLGVEGVVSIRDVEVIEYDSSHYSETGSMVGEIYLPFDPVSGIPTAAPYSIYTLQEYDISTENSTRVHLTNDGKIQFVIWSPNHPLGGLLIDGPAISKGDTIRFAVAWENNNCEAYFNGSVGTVFYGDKTSILVPQKANVNRFYLGSRNSSGYPQGSYANRQDQQSHVPIKFLKLFNRRLTNSELSLMSTL